MELDASAFLLVGLGNPGREYRNNRHNVGFMVIDAISQHAGIRISKMQSKALTGRGDLAGSTVILAKPQTFMNKSGVSVSGLLRFYKIPLSQLLVVYDDLDLPFGTIRLRPAGGSAGQNGMKSIIGMVGGEDFPRLRVGIGSPPGKMAGAKYVLRNFPEADQEVLALVLRRAVDAVSCFLQEGIQKAMSKYNGSV